MTRCISRVCGRHRESSKVCRPLVRLSRLPEIQIALILAYQPYSLQHQQSPSTLSCLLLSPPPLLLWFDFHIATTNNLICMLQTPPPPPPAFTQATPYNALRPAIASFSIQRPGSTSPHLIQGTLFFDHQSYLFTLIAANAITSLVPSWQR